MLRMRLYAHGWVHCAFMCVVALTRNVCGSACMCVGTCTARHMGRSACVYVVCVHICICVCIYNHIDICVCVRNKKYLHKLKRLYFFVSNGLKSFQWGNISKRFLNGLYGMVGT